MTLTELAKHYGIESEYSDIWGNIHHTSDAVIQDVLHAFGHNFEEEVPQPIVHSTYLLYEDEDLKEKYPKMVDPISPLSLGYYQCSFEDGSIGLLIVAPRKCYLPADYDEGGKRWGISTQLYSLASKENLGIGDLSDLKKLMLKVTAAGGSFVGLNPLHALFPANPLSISPYSPSSRVFWNINFISICDIPEIAKLPEISAKFDRLKSETILSEFVDYATVVPKKLGLLRELFQAFENSKDSRHQKFKKFVSQNDNLKDFALFQALHEHLFSKDQSYWGWPVWPEPYRDHRSAAVEKFKNEHQQEILFYCYLQWIFEEQLAETKQLGCDLYLDLALGVNVGGADTWLERDYYAFGLSAGAPPDLLNVQGQQWGLPPLIPHKLIQFNFAPFIRALKRNMKYADILRMDHVMSLLRLFVVPAGRSGKEGCYIRYPVEELMAIVCLESVLNECVVIGEDLGTVPDQIRHEMQQRAMLSTKLLVFMKDNDHFIPAENYPRLAAASFSSHDLPTISGYFAGRDIEWREKLGLFSEWITAEGERKSREYDLDLIKELVKDHDSDLTSAITKFLLSTPSYLTILSLEDFLQISEQINLPGTVDEHPNWRRVLEVSHLGLLEIDWYLNS
jgi:(1->4)-alpha-D-glucan 1-alpha-D-glucosylmutase